MLKLLLAVDGSDSSLHAAAHLIKRVQAAPSQYQVHLLNVQYPVHGSVSRFINASQIKQYHHDEGIKVLSTARKLLNDAGVTYDCHLFVGDPAEVIARYAKEHGCDEIMIGARGFSGISGLLMGSVATKVLHLSEVPVVLVK
jgi:nucleotide-binding universal stress UspA family protein